MESVNREELSIAVVGVGAFGKNHARVYRELADDGVKLAAVVDADLARAQAITAEHGGRPFASVSDLLASGLKIHAASVAVPTVYHLAAARQLMEAGIDVLIEKPLAFSLDQADELVSLASKLGRVAQAGHLERFNPAVRATWPLLTRPMFFEVHRLSVFTPRSLDVDVVLDLMIHDLDIVLKMAKSPVREVRAVGLPVLTGKVDIASVRLEFESGCIANLTASRISTERVRKLRFFQPAQYVSLDYSRRDVFSLTVQPTEGGVPQIVPYKPPVSSEEPLRAELSSFLRAVRERSQPEVTLADGRAALSLAIEIQQQMADHRKRAHLEDVGSILHVGTPKDSGSGAD
ncbi:MAG: Gfo/Idh/MocA family oxidoreductase [Acidobacteriota bacterium]|nr:Gfo/Idh/MocA family oxidoreductase [Acidobacteriota bacterium]